MGVRGGRQPAAHVKKLPDAHAGDVGDGAGLELAGLDGQLSGLRVHMPEPVGLVPVGGEIVFPAQKQIADPGDAGHLGAELRFRDAQFGPEPVHGFGLGEPGLHLGSDGVCDIKQPVSDDTLVRCDTQGIPAATCPARTGSADGFPHRAPSVPRGLRAVVHANVRVRVNVPPGPARPSGR